MDDGAPVPLQRVLAQAAAETRELRHGYIGSGHLLLALAASAGMRAAQHLKRAGARYPAVRARIVTIVGIGGDDVISQQVLPYTPNAIAVVRRVRHEADEPPAEAIGSEHVLRALLDRHDSLAVRVLEDVGVDLRALASALRQPRADDE